MEPYANRWTVVPEVFFYGCASTVVARHPVGRRAVRPNGATGSGRTVERVRGDLVLGVTRLVVKQIHLVLAGFSVGVANEVS